MIKLIEIVFNNPFRLLLNARFSPSQQSTWVRTVFVLRIWSTTMWAPWTPNSGLIAGGSVVTMVGLCPRDIAVQHWMLQPQLPDQNLAHCRLSVNTLQFINAWKSGSLLESSCAHTFTNVPLGVSFAVFCDLTTSSCFILTFYSPVVPKQTNLNQTSLSHISLPLTMPFPEPQSVPKTLSSSLTLRFDLNWFVVQVRNVYRVVFVTKASCQKTVTTTSFVCVFDSVNWQRSSVFQDGFDFLYFS